MTDRYEGRYVQPVSVLECSDKFSNRKYCRGQPKLRIYRALLSPIAIYANEAWSPTKSDEIIIVRYVYITYVYARRVYEYSRIRIF